MPADLSLARLPWLAPGTCVFSDLAALGFEVGEVALGDCWDCWAHALFDVEAQSLHRVVPRRRWEMIAGRVTAHVLMRRAGWPVQAIPQAADRAPVWPVGLLGSITHTDARCAVAIHAADAIAAFGIDMEPMTPLEPALWDIICTSTERVALAAGDWPVSDGLVVACLFAAKEAFYKAWHPVTGRFLDPHDVQVDLAPDLASFRIRCRAEHGFQALSGPLARGRLSLRSGHIAAAWIVEHPATTRPQASP